jgi:hypothetical protein
MGAGVIGVTVAFAAWRAGRFRQRPTDVQVARYVEERAPNLDEALVSATESITKANDSPIVGLLIADAAARVGAVDLDTVVSRADLRRQAVQAAAAGAVLIASLVLLREPVLQGLEVLRMRVAPPQLALEVEPGNAIVREGTQVSFRARVTGLPVRVPREALTVRLDLPEGGRALAMQPEGQWQTVALDRAEQTFTYQVSGHGLTSSSFRVEVKPRPRVTRIDLHYRFPSFSGLEPHVAEDSGDIYAPAGTRVRMVVHTSVPVEKADVGLGSGATVPLGSTLGRTTEGELVVSRDDTYRLTLVEADGERTIDDTEYFVRTVDDRPPEVRIVRPAGDKRVTRLEEVVIEARADDDFGVDGLELVYAARGGAETAVRLAGRAGESATGRHTLFLEELDVQPGDFVSYYARARDVGRGKRPTEVRSDIFFLEVRPFNEEFQAAQSAAMMGAGGGAFDDLAARQKELIIATWKIERRSRAGRSADDVRALARAQGELKAKAEQVAARLVPQATSRRSRQGQAQQEPAAAAADQPMRRAVEAMGRSQQALEAQKPGEAIPHEMEALNQLLRADAEVTRRQVARQQSAGGGGGGRSGNQDLSSLFDRELQRQQQTNYETRATTQEAEQREQQGSEALDKLRELARRQDELGRRQAELARRRGQMAADEARRQLERLTREQEDVRRELERLSAELGQQQQQSGGQSSSRGGQQSGSLQQAADAMRQAASGLSGERLSEAAQEAQRAADRLRQAERAMAGTLPDEAARQAGDLKMQAGQLAELERRLARQLREGNGLSADQLRQMAGEQERAAERAASLGRNARAAVGSEQASRDPRQGAGQAGQAGQEGARTLADGRLEADLRASARSLRELAGQGSGAGREQPRQEAERAEGIARALETAARALGRGVGDTGDRSALSEQLARAGELRDRLGELTRQLREGARTGEGRAQGRDQAGEAPSSQGQQGQGQAASGQSPSQSGRQGQGAAGGQGSGGGDGRPGPEEVARELRSLQRLAEGLGEDGEGLRRALQTLEGYAPGRSAPGTESWKQDFARWESLRRDVGESLEQVQARLSEQLRAEERENRLDAGASDAAPDAFRREVARYYRALARKPQS